MDSQSIQIKPSNGRGRPRKPDSEKVKNLPQVKIYLPIELWQAIREYTESNKIKQNTIILQAIQAYLL